MIVFRPMQPSAEAFACGKLILSGEHSVVYGQPAIAIPVSRGVRVYLDKYDGPTHMPSADETLQRALLSILPPEGLKVRMESTLPLGRGMGSSAALAVACLRALAQMSHEALSFEAAFARAFAMERVFHGNPSGVDHAVSASGQAVFYKKGHDKPIIQRLEIPNLSLVVMDTGQAGDTGKMVAKVRKGVGSKLHTINDMGTLTQALHQQLTHDNPDLKQIGQLLNANHEHLKTLGVSTPRLNTLCQLAREAGAYGAKLAGAGGGGVAFALVEDAAPVLAAVRPHCADAFCVSTTLETA